MFESSFLPSVVYDQVWRRDFTTPGFHVLDVPPGIDSHGLRAFMVSIKEQLSEEHHRRTGRKFVFRSMGRFDQQDTTKFHLDGGPDESLLMLGYEPSTVFSRFFLADYTRAAFDVGLTPKQYLLDHNPMYHEGEERLRRYRTELPQPAPDHSRIVLINNSCLPFTADRVNPLGVMHKGEIPAPDATRPRIINSILLVPGDEDEVGLGKQREFIETVAISNKIYQEE